MILLTSDGITSPQLEEEIKKAQVPISRRAALVTTASCRYKEKDHNVPVLSALMRRFGLEPECVDVEFQDATFLLAYDVVILMGGNPFYLRKHLNKWKNSLEVLTELANRHVLIGISAGSMENRGNGVFIVDNIRLKKGENNIRAVGHLADDNDEYADECVFRYVCMEN